MSGCRRNVTLAEWAAWRLRHDENAGGSAVAAECGCAPSSLYSVLKRRGGVDVLAARAAGRWVTANGASPPTPLPYCAIRLRRREEGGNGERRLTPTPLLMRDRLRRREEGNGERRLTPALFPYSAIRLRRREEGVTANGASPRPLSLLAQTAGETGGGGERRRRGRGWRCARAAGGRGCRSGDSGDAGGGCRADRVGGHPGVHRCARPAGGVWDVSTR